MTATSETARSRTGAGIIRHTYPPTKTKLLIGLKATVAPMTAQTIGHARASTNEQDLTAHHDGHTVVGIPANPAYVYQGMTGRTRERPGLRDALAGIQTSDTLVVPKLERVARALPMGTSSKSWPLSTSPGARSIALSNGHLMS